MKNRFFQFLRGICIICVVLIHLMWENVNEYINFFNIGLRSILNFCVAIFIFMSAYFIKQDEVKRAPKKFIVKRLKRIMIPLVIWNVFYCVISIFVGDKTNVVIKKFLMCNSAAQLYYIIALVQLILLTPGILKLKESKKRALYIITPVYLLLIFVLRIKWNFIIPMYQYWFFGWLIYYLIGLDIKNIMCNNKINNYNVKNICKVISWLIISICCNILLYNYKRDTYSYVTSQLNIFNMMFVISIIPVIMNWNIKYKSNKKIYRKTR